MKRIFLSLIIISVALSVLCGCDLSHKHYCDDFGVCKTCFENVGHPLSTVNGKLSSGEVFAKDGEKLYFRFKPNGVGRTVITLTFKTAVMDSSGIDVYTKSTRGIATFPLYSEDENIKRVRIDAELDPDEIYYFSFSVKTHGTLIAEADCHLSDM